MSSVDSARHGQPYASRRLAQPSRDYVTRISMGQPHLRLRFGCRGLWAAGWVLTWRHVGHLDGRVPVRNDISRGRVQSCARLTVAASSNSSWAARSWDRPSPSLAAPSWEINPGGLRPIARGMATLAAAELGEAAGAAGAAEAEAVVPDASRACRRAWCASRPR